MPPRVDELPRPLPAAARMGHGDIATPPGPVGIKAWRFRHSVCRCSSTSWSRFLSFRDHGGRVRRLIIGLTGLLCLLTWGCDDGDGAPTADVAVQPELDTGVNPTSAPTPAPPRPRPSAPCRPPSIRRATAPTWRPSAAPRGRSPMARTIRPRPICARRPSSTPGSRSPASRCPMAARTSSASCPGSSAPPSGSSSPLPSTPRTTARAPATTRRAPPACSRPPGS